MRKWIYCALAAISALCFVGCKKEGDGGSPEGDLTIKANTFKAGYKAENIMDGNIASGWISSRKATESSFQTVTIDLGKKTAFNTITLDDSFIDGYTNKRPSHVQAPVVYGSGNTSSMEKGTSIANLTMGIADGQSWKSKTIPTTENCQWVWLSLQDAVTVSKVTLDNQMNNSVPANYALYYSSTAQPNDKTVYSNPDNYTLLSKATDNDKNVVDVLPEGEVTIKDLLYCVYEQTNEGESVVAALDEILFYSSAPADYYESHQPVVFTILASNDGKTYDTELVAENGNYDEVWVHTLESTVEYRYIRYIVFEENNNNFPSIGELKFEVV